MGPVRVLLALSVLASGVLYVQTAPTDVVGPPRTLEDDLDVNPSGIPFVDEAEGAQIRDNHEEVRTDERFYRVLDDGTIEFKTALSNGHIQYQRIRNKVVDGKTIQVYEGYTSERYADGRYGTRYYIADENGYRVTKVDVDTVPPVLPESGPYTSDQQPEGPVLRKTEENEDKFTSSADVKRHSIYTPEEHVEISEEDEQVEGSGGEQTLPVTEGNVVKSNEEVTSAVPVVEENNSSSNEINTELNNSVKPAEEIEPSTELSKTEENTSTPSETTSEVEANSVKTIKVHEASTGLPKIKESSISSIEDDAAHSETGTELPVVEDDSVKTIEDHEASTELPKIEASSISSIEDEAAHSETSTGLPETEDNSVKAVEDHEASTELPQIEENLNSSPKNDVAHSETSTGLPETEDNSVKAVEDHEASTELPKIEENSNSSVEDNAAHNEISTELPVFEDDSVKAIEDHEASTELPKIEQFSNSPVEDDTAHIETSTELPVVEDDSVKTIEEASTELPKIKENSNSSVEDDAAHSETSTELPVVEDDSVKTIEDHEASTELPKIEENSNSSVEDDAAHSETSTELPVVEDDSVKTIEDHEASTELPKTETNTGTYVQGDGAYGESSSKLPVVEDNNTKVTEELEVSPKLPNIGDTAVQSEITTELPTTEAIVDHSETALSEEKNFEETTQTIEKYSIDHQTSTHLPEVLSTEESLSENNEVIDHHYDTDKTIEDKDIHAVEGATKAAIEENVTKSVEEVEDETSTDLTAIIEDKYLEPIIETSHVTSEASVPSIDDIDASTEALPASEEHANYHEDKTVEATSSPIIEDKHTGDHADHIEGSTEGSISESTTAPKIEESLLHSTEEEEIGSSTETPTLIDILTKKIDTSTVLPALDATSSVGHNEQSIDSNDNLIKFGEDTYIPVSIGEPATLTSKVNATSTVLTTAQDLLAVENSAVQTSEHKGLDVSQDDVTSEQATLLSTKEHSEQLNY